MLKGDTKLCVKRHLNVSKHCNRTETKCDCIKFAWKCLHFNKQLSSYMLSTCALGAVNISTMLNGFFSFENLINDKRHARELFCVHF